MNLNPWTTRALHALLCAATLLSTACGGGGGDAPAAPDKVEQSIGSSGGALAHASGASVTIPAAALAANTSVAIETAPAGSGGALPGVAVGSAFWITPHGQSFAQPVTVSIPFDPAQVPAGAQVSLLKTSNGANGPWIAVAGASVSGNRISGQVGSFSGLVAALLPQITRQPQSLSVTSGQVASFDVTAIGFNPPFSYQWRRWNDGGAAFVDLPGQTAATLTLGATSATAAAQGGDDGALFEVIVSNAGGSVRSATATLTVTAAITAPAITTQPQNASAAVGSSTTFNVVATGTNLVYQWQKNGTPIAGQTNASLTLSNLQLSDAGSYTVVISNLLNGTAANSVTSSVATLTVTSAPPPPSNASSLAAGGDFSLTASAGGVPSSWGSDSSGTLGNGGADQDRNTPAPLGTLTGVRSVAAASLHSVAVLNDGTARAWGYNTCRFDGSANIFSSATPAVFTGFGGFVSASTGSDHLLLLGPLPLGKVLALGCNFSSQLGYAPGAPVVLFVAGLPPVTAVAGGGSLSLALDSTGNVWSWGSGALGDGSAIGQPTALGRATPVKIIDRAGATPVVAIAAGRDHALALTSDGAVLAWGRNTNGKLGDGTSVDRLTPVPTLLTSGSGVTAIGAGRENSIALRGRGNGSEVLTWGINETGQLGSGSLSPGFRLQPAPVVGLTDVVEVSFGDGELGHALARKSDGSVWAWGHNNKGQLGNGSAAPFSATPVQATGLNLN